MYHIMFVYAPACICTTPSDYRDNVSAMTIVRMIRGKIGLHIGATWRIRSNRSRAAAMRPFVKLLRPLVIIQKPTSTKPQSVS